MKRSRPLHARAATTLLSATLAIGLVACGDDDDSSTAAAAPDLERYCELVAELDAASAATFGALEGDAQLSEAEIADAQQQVLDENEDLIEELERVAPNEIRDDLEVSIESTRARAEEDVTDIPEDDVVDANLRLQKFRREECPKG
jgi:hypothetical protein